MLPAYCRNLFCLCQFLRLKFQDLFAPEGEEGEAAEEAAEVGLPGDVAAEEHACADDQGNPEKNEGERFAESACAEDAAFVQHEEGHAENAADGAGCADDGFGG